MNIENTSHMHIQQLLPLVASGMLTDVERQEVDQHVAVCEACRATLEQLIQADRELAELFAPVNPPLGFEERVLANWRPARFNISLRPGSRKVIAAAAAAILLGTVGYVGGQLIDNNRLPGAAAMVASGDGMTATRPESTQSIEGKVSSRSETEAVAHHVVAGDAVSSEYWDRNAGRPEVDGERRRDRGAQLGDLNGDIASHFYNYSSTEGLLGEKFGRYDANGRTLAMGNAVTLGRAFQPAGGEGGVQAATLGWVENNDYANSPSASFGSAGGTLLLTDGHSEAPGRSTTVGTSSSAYDGGTLITNHGGSDHASLSLGSAGLALGVESKGKSGTVAGRATVLQNATKADDGAVAVQGVQAGHFKLSELSAWYAADTGAKGVAFGGSNKLGAAVDVVGKRVQAAAEYSDMDLAEKTGISYGLEVQRLRTDLSQAAPIVPAGGNAPTADGTTPSGGVTGATVQPPAPEASVLQARKIIRNGDMEFEVDSFDTSFATISRIVGEEKGYVSSTSSEKLPNGKVRGVIVVRVTPDRLDTLVLKLRALGDLKSQKISAQDITKVYYDLDSELRAARTMEERIINIIKSGKGEVKDLIEAEKQLGTYREKIEKLEGEIRYYNNMVSLSTLNITAAEKAISSPATVQVTENVSTGIETEDVEKSRADAIKAIEELKGRVLDSNLKKYDAGQLAANITAEISPEASGQLIDRLRQIGRMTRLDIDRKQSSAGQAQLNAPAPRVEKKDTRFVISLYNLANIAPRQTTTASLAVANVEEAYKSILAGVKAHGGRVVSSNLNRQKPEQTTAAISFEVPGEQADATLLELRREREVMSLTVAENPDTQNVTSAKHGFSLQLQSLGSVAPRETETLVLVSKADVNGAFRKLLDELRKADVRILTSQLNEQDASNLSGNIDVEVMRSREAEARAALASAGVIFSRTVARSSDTDSTVDTKIRLQIRMVGLNQLAPAQTARLSVETPDVETRASELKLAAAQLGGRVLDSRQMTSATGQVTSRLVLDVPLAKAAELRAKVQDAGKVRTTDSTQNPAMADSPLARARLEVSLTNASPIVSDDSGLGAAFRKAVATSIRGLLWSVQAIIIGALIVVPWAAILWGGWKVVRRRKAKAVAEPA